MSPQRELSWISPSVASFLFSPMYFFYHVSSERIFMDFTLSGFLFIFPRGFIPCLFEREPQILPSMALHFHLPRGFLYRVSLKGNHRFCLQQLYTLHFPEDLHRVSSERTITDFCLQWSFIFIISGYCVSPKRTSTGFTLNGFHFTFKSPIVLSSQGPLFILLL